MTTNEDNRRKELNEAFIGEFVQNMVVMAGLRSKIETMPATNVNEVKALTDALEKLTSVQEKTYGLHRLALGINDKSPAVAIDNRRYVVAIPAGVGNRQEWIEKYGRGEIIDVD